MRLEINRLNQADGTSIPPWFEQPSDRMLDSRVNNVGNYVGDFVQFVATPPAGGSFTMTAESESGSIGGYTPQNSTRTWTSLNREQLHNGTNLDQHHNDGPIRHEPM